MKLTESLTWIPVADFRPDSDTTVVLFDATASEPVWPGYLDGEAWRYVDGMPANPTHWSDLPKGPQESSAISVRSKPIP